MILITPIPHLWKILLLNNYALLIVHRWGLRNLLNTVLRQPSIEFGTGDMTYLTHVLHSQVSFTLVKDLGTG